MTTSIIQKAENNNILIIKNRIKNLIGIYKSNNLIVTEELVKQIRNDRTLKNLTNNEISSKLNEVKEEDKLIYLKLGIQIDSNYFIKDIVNHYNKNKNLTIISILIKNYVYKSFEDNKDVLLKFVKEYNNNEFKDLLQKYIHNLISLNLSNKLICQKYVNLALYVFPEYFLNEVIQDYINNEDEKLLSKRFELYDWKLEKNINVLKDYVKKSRNIPLKVLDILKNSNKKKEIEKFLSQNINKRKREYYYFAFDTLLKTNSKKSINNSNITNNNYNKVIINNEINYELMNYNELPLAEFEVSENDNDNKTINDDNNTVSNNTEKYNLKELLRLEKVVGTLIGKYLKKNDENIIKEIKSYPNYSICSRPNILSHLQKKENERYSKYEYLVLGLKIDKEYFCKWIKEEKDRFSVFIKDCGLTNDLDINPIVQKLNFEDNEILKIIQDKILSTHKFSFEWQKYIKIGLYFNINLYISELIEDYINNREKSILIFFISNYENHFKELVNIFIDKLIDYHLYDNQLGLDINNLTNFYEILSNNYFICLKENGLKSEKASNITNFIENIIYKRFCKRFPRRDNHTFSHKLIKIGILMIPKFFIKEFIDDYHNNKNNSILISILNSFKSNKNIESKILYRFYKSCFDKEFLLIVHKLIQKRVERIKNNIDKKIKYLELGLSLDPKYYISFIIKDFYEIKNNKLLSLINIFAWNNDCFDIVLQLLNNSEHIPNEILDKLINSDRSSEAKSLLEQKKDILKDEYLYFLSKIANNSNYSINNVKKGIINENSDNSEDDIIKQTKVQVYRESLKETKIENESLILDKGNNGNLLETDLGCESSNKLESENKELEESDIENEITDDITDASSEIIEKTVSNKDTSEVIANDTLTTDQTNYINKTNNGDGLLKSTGIAGNKSEEAETQTEFENNKSVSVEQIIDLIDLENTLEKAGVCKSETKPFAAYLLSAYMHKIPVLLAGPCGEQIANAFSVSVCGVMPYVFDCKKEYSTNLIEDILKSKNEVVVIKHPFASEWRESLLELLAEGEKFYILTNPFYEDLQIEPISLYNSVMPFITELIIDKPPVFETLKPTKIELSKPTNKFISMHNELLKVMKLSPYCINQIQTLLSEMNHIMGKDSTIIDYKYVLFPYAYVTNQGDRISEKWLEVDKDAERYISKYFNIIKTAIEY